jgi:nitroreductase
VSDEGFFEVAARQRGCRRYTDEPVDDATVVELLAAACWAPSAENHQPWRFVVVREAATRAAFGALMKEIWDAGGRQYSERRTGPVLFRDVERGIAAGGLASAPVLIVVGGDTTVVDRTHLKSSVFPAVQNLLLAATARGLGSCLTTIATLRADELRALVGFPLKIDPLAMVPIGYPTRSLSPPRRDPMASKAFRERYGTPWSG